VESLEMWREHPLNLEIPAESSRSTLAALRLRKQARNEEGSVLRSCPSTVVRSVRRCGGDNNGGREDI
jgi:hypothetical protein